MTATANHTPGPWTPSWNDDRSHIGVDCGDENDPRQAEVCSICYESACIANEDDEAWAMCMADAFLIAAAPELLEAARDCVSALGKRDAFLLPEEKAALNRARAAIAKTQVPGIAHHNWRTDR